MNPKIISELKLDKFYKPITLIGIILIISGIFETKFLRLGFICFLYGILFWMISEGFGLNETKIIIKRKGFFSKVENLLICYITIIILLFISFVYSILINLPK